MILVRHGQSEFNAAFSVTRIDPGIPDPKLTDEGRRQAAAAAEALRGAGVRRLIASPYRRALETASIIADGLGLGVTIEPLVRERAAFRCDIGTSPNALSTLFPRYRFDHLDDPWWHDHINLGTAETEEALAARGVAFRSAMAALSDWAEVAVITHWGFIRALTGRPVANCEIVRFDPREPVGLQPHTAP
jgi:broad specificity phosphatase PhoE